VSSGMAETELRRARWVRHRKRLALHLPQDSGFCADPFGHEPGASVRMLVLPSDPDQEFLDFTPSLWQSLSQLMDPVTGKSARWGHPRPTSEAALLKSPQTGNSLSRYLAVYRNGAIEVGLGAEAFFESQGRRCFRLVTIVGRLWAGLSTYSALQAGVLSISNPCQVVVGLRCTEGASLGQLNAGWDAHIDEYTPRCLAPAIGLAFTVDCWGESVSIRELAFRIGGWLEDSFGSMERRFLNPSNPDEGSFAAATYGW